MKRLNDFAYLCQSPNRCPVCVQSGERKLRGGGKERDNQERTSDFSYTNRPAYLIEHVVKHLVKDHLR